MTIWDLETGKTLKTIDKLPADVESVAWRPDSTQIAAGEKGGTIRLFNPADGATQGTITQPADTVLGLAYLPDSKGLLSAGSDGLVRLWTLPIAETKAADPKKPPAPADV